MHLFEIRNYLSILTAKEIIKKYKIKEYKFLIPYFSKDYLNKIKEKLSVDDSMIVPINEKIYISKNPLKYYLAERKIKKKLEIEKIDELYLCNTHAIEKHLYKIFEKNYKKINFFEEGTNCYFDYEGKKLHKKNEKYKSKIFFKYKEIFFQEIKYDKVFMCFPQKYRYNNYKELLELSLKFELLENRAKVENMFLTRPLSEDKIITEELEIELIVSYIKKNNYDKIFFKNHPRESKNKIEKIISILLKNKIEVIQLKDFCPAEELIKYYDIQKLIGFETGALVYLSEFYNIKVDSLLKSTVEKSNNKFLKSFYKFYKDNFKKINYV